MPKYTLRYFEAKGRGELIRLVLVLKGEGLEDKRYSQETWPSEKANTPFGQMPVLTIDGKDYTESLAIARFLANEFGYNGSSNEDRYAIDRVIYICQDLFSQYVKVFFAEEGKKEEAVKNKTESQEKFLGNLEKIVSAKANGYVVGDKLSLGDLALFDIVDGHVTDEQLAKFPNVKAIVSNVKANDNIKKYLSTRPETPI